MRLLTMVTAVALLGVAGSARAADDWAMGADLRCVSAFAYLITNPQYKDNATIGMFYYLGRIEGRDPTFDLAKGLAQVRQRILDHPVEPALLAQVEAAVSARFGTERVRFRSLLSGNSPRLAQPVQLAAEHQPLDGRTARARAKNAGGNIPGRVFRRDHRHSSHRRTLRSWRGVDQSPT